MIMTQRKLRLLREGQPVLGLALAAGATPVFRAATADCSAAAAGLNPKVTGSIV